MGCSGVGGALRRGMQIAVPTPPGPYLGLLFSILLSIYPPFLFCIVSILLQSNVAGWRREVRIWREAVSQCRLLQQPPGGENCLESPNRQLARKRGKLKCKSLHWQAVE